MTSQEARKFLPAFADGELDVEQNLRVLEQMAMDPTNTKRVMHQQQLRQACARVMCRDGSCCPDELKAKISAMCCEMEKASGGGRRGPVLGRLGRWIAPLAVAAVLLVGAWVAFEAVSRHGYTADGLMTASLAQSFGQRHVECTLGQVAPHEAELFPATIDQLDDTLVSFVGRDLDGAALDLSSMGYDYRIAGLCPIPGGDAVHVIYENDTGRSLSLWIKHYDGQPTLDPGVPYIPPHEHTRQPMMVWRDGDTVFYLVGDTMDDVRLAHGAIHLARAG